MTHPIIDEHPAIRELNVRAADVAHRQRELYERVGEEDQRYERERREYAAALDRGDLDVQEPRPRTDYGQQARNLADAMHELSNQRRELIRRHADQLLRSLDRHESRTLEALYEQAQVFVVASQELKSVIDARARVVGTQTPGASQGEYPAEPTDVLTAVLSGVERLPARERRTTFAALAQ